MKAKVWVLLEHAVGLGVAYGLRRHFKHHDNPLEDAELAALADSISDHVMTEIGEWFEKEGDDE
jgi:hypothetical protein